MRERERESERATRAWRETERHTQRPVAAAPAPPDAYVSMDDAETRFAAAARRGTGTGGTAQLAASASSARETAHTAVAPPLSRARLLARERPTWTRARSQTLSLSLSLFLSEEEEEEEEKELRLYVAGCVGVAFARVTGGLRLGASVARRAVLTGSALGFALRGERGRGDGGEVARRQFAAELAAEAAGTAALGGRRARRRLRRRSPRGVTFQRSQSWV